MRIMAHTEGGIMRILGIDPGYAIMGYGILDYKGKLEK